MDAKGSFRKVALVLMVWALLVGTSSTPVYAQDPDPGDRGGEIVTAIRTIATVVIDILIGAAVALMAVGIAAGFVGGELLVAVGQPYGLSSAWVKVISIVILGLGALLTIVIVNTVINAVAALVPPTVIPTI